MFEINSLQSFKDSYGRDVFVIQSPVICARNLSALRDAMGEFKLDGRLCSIIGMGVHAINTPIRISESIEVVVAWKNIEPSSEWLHTKEVLLELSSPEEGKKFDQGKLRYDLLPPDALQELVRIYTFGTQKYGDRNWEQGINYMRIYRAIWSHLQAWIMHETLDKESGLPHLAHAVWNVIALLSYELRGMKEFDDRPVLSNVKGNQTSSEFIKEE